MRSAVRTVLLWAVLLGVLPVVLVGFDAGSELGGGATPALAVALLATAALTMALLAAGLALGWRRRREPRPAEEAAVPDLSVPTVVVALGLGDAVVGAEVGRAGPRRATPAPSQLGVRMRPLSRTVAVAGRASRESRVPHASRNGRSGLPPRRSPRGGFEEQPEE